MKKTLLLLAFIGCCSYASFSQSILKSNSDKISDVSRKQLRNYLRSFEIYDYDLQDLINSFKENRSKYDLTITLKDTAIKITLFPVELRSFDYQSSVNGKVSDSKAETITYKGFAGVQSNRVRLTITNKMLRGYIDIGKKRLFIEQLYRHKIKDSLEKHKTIVYNQSDIINDPNSYCGVSSEQEQKFIKSSLEGKSHQKTLGLTSECKFLRLATEANYEYYLDYGSNANNEILSIINMIQDLYIDNFNFEILVVYQNVWTTSSDPYTGDPNTDPGSELLVNELKNYWNTYFTSVSRNITHLFAGGYYFSSGVLGRVYDIGTVCRYPDQSYGFTKDRFEQFATTAHEIGHDFGGLHSDGVNCGTLSASTMCQGLNKAVPLYFSPASLTRIGNHISSYGSCLNPNSYLAMTGPDRLACASGTGNFSVPSIPGATYTWSVGSPLVITSSPGLTSNSISLNASNYNFVSASVSVTINGVSECPIIITKDINGGMPLPPESLDIYNPPHSPTMLCSTGYYFEVNFNDNSVTKIHWSLPSGWTSPSGSGSNFYTNVVPGNNRIRVYTNGLQRGDFFGIALENSCGVGMPLNTYVSNLDCGSEFRIYPNPANTIITIEPNLSINAFNNDIHLNRLSESKGNQKVETVIFKILNSQGKILLTKLTDTSQQKTNLDVSNIPNGNYFLHIISNKTTLRKQIIINH